MNMTNYHSHCLYCDGRADMDVFVRFALSRRFTAYGFSSHAPLPFPTPWTMEWDRMDDYLSDFRRLKERYKERIELYVGLEIDYLNEESNPSVERFRLLPLDYRIGAVHLLYDGEGCIVDADVDAGTFRKMVNTHFSGDLEFVVRLYYQRSLRLLELGGFDIVAHPDKIHYNASLYRPGLLDEPWYDKLVRDYFAEIVQRGYMMEINTKSYGDLGVFFPDKRYFRFLHDIGARVVVNSDAHYPDRIDCGREEALKVLAHSGFTTVAELHGGAWLDVRI